MKTKSNNKNLWVITACLNESSNIENHLIHLNKLNDLFGVCYIVVDGGSTDQTAEKIRRCLRSGCLLIENGGGIYQSWNLAVKMILGTANHVAFLGVGDSLSREFLNHILMDSDILSADILFGRLKIGNQVYPLQLVEGVKSRIYSLIGCMPIHHAGTFFSIGLFREIGLFDEKYKIAGDYEWMMRLKNYRNITVRVVENDAVTMKPGGVSSASRSARKVLYEELRICLIQHRIPCLKRILYLIKQVTFNVFRL